GDEAVVPPHGLLGERVDEGGQEAGGHADLGDAAAVRSGDAVVVQASGVGAGDTDVHLGGALVGAESGGDDAEGGAVNSGVVPGLGGEFGGDDVEGVAEVHGFSCRVGRWCGSGGLGPQAFGGDAVGGGQRLAGGAGADLVGEL